MARRPDTSFLDAFSRAHRRLATVIGDAYAPLEIGVTQAKLLRAIGDAARVSQAELARTTATDPAATGRALRTLLTRGWVRRKRSRSDRRAFSLELTPEGQEILGRLRSIRSALGKRVLASLDDGDLTAFERIVDKILVAFPE